MKLNKEFFTGKGEYLSSRYRSLYGEGSYRDRVQREQKKIAGRYALVLLLVLVMVAFSVSRSLDEGPAMQVKQDGSIVSVQRPARSQGTESIPARVVAVSPSGRAEMEKQILIQPQGKKTSNEDGGLLRTESEEERLQRKINTAVRSLNDNTDRRKVILPTHLDDGTRLYWQRDKENDYPGILAGGLLLLFVVFRSRYDNIKREEKNAREDVVRELPGFINKLVLLTNAGVVLNSAFVKVMEDRRTMAGEKEGYFYSQLEDVYMRSRETNSPFHKELAAFARRSGVRELMRVSNVINDNIDKGTELTGKLRREGDALWFARKKQSEEKGRLAETKMTLPLVMLLCVLVLITIAPAMMDM